MDKSNMIHTITTLKLLARDRRLKEDQINAIFDAIEMLREYDNEIELKKSLIDNIGKNYIFSPSDIRTEYAEGFNAATRGILDLLDPTQQRYKGAST